jgi:hypothetical protein
VRLRALLDELAEQLGPADEDMMNQAVQELTGFVCRVRVAEPPERIQLLEQHPCHHAVDAFIAATALGAGPAMIMTGDPEI